MKKTVLCVILVLAVLFLAACGQSVKIGSFSSLIFNADDFDEAVNALIVYFKNFEGCTLQEVKYAGDAAVRAEAAARGYAPEQIIVLEIAFSTDGADHKNGLEPDHSYDNYQFIFVRDVVGGMWDHLDHGYC